MESDPPRPRRERRLPRAGGPPTRSPAPGGPPLWGPAGSVPPASRTRGARPPRRDVSGPAGTSSPSAGDGATATGHTAHLRLGREPQPVNCGCTATWAQREARALSVRAAAPLRNRTVAVTT